MKYDWILDVLVDLRTFAQANGLNALAQELEQTRMVASVEIASSGDMAGGAWPHGEDRKTGDIARRTRTGARA